MEVIRVDPDCPVSEGGMTPRLRDALRQARERGTILVITITEELKPRLNGRAQNQLEHAEAS